MPDKERKRSFLNSKGEEFDQKYQGLIYSLSRMPKITNIEKEARIQFVKNNTDFTLFLSEVFRAVKPYEYDAMLHSLSSGSLFTDQELVEHVYSPEEYENPYPGNYYPIESGELLEDDLSDTIIPCFYYRRVSKPKKEFDSVAFLEAVYEAIRTYSFEGESSKYSFRQDIGAIYERKYGNTLFSDTPFSISPQKQRAFRKIAGIVNRSNHSDLSTPDLKRRIIEIIEENPALRKYVSLKEDLDYICTITIGMKTVSLQADADEGGIKKAGLISTPYDGLVYEQIINREQLISLIKAIAVLFKDKKWSLSKAKYEDFKIFVTHTILRELKTDANGMVYQKVPAGNYEVYEALKGCEDMLMNGVFLEKYLEYLYCKYPSDFNAVYMNLLKDCVVKFEDKLMADCLQISSDKLSKQKKKFYKLLAGFKEYLYE